MFFPLLSPTVLYAETHYRFKYFFSFLKKPEPEILADMPHRIEPDVPLPILLLVKDSHHYPVVLKNVKIEIFTRGKNLTHHITLLSEAVDVKEALWWKVIDVDLEQSLKGYFGFLDIDVYVTYEVNQKERTCKNDNYRTSSKRSFTVYRSQEKLPTLEGWVQGDTHTHSSYTDDQVEFGAPIGASVKLSKAMGLSFFCVTDHSYDLDDRIDNYLINDPSIPKWMAFQREIEAINSMDKNFAVIRGEELSCLNENSKNIHLLLWGTKKFFQGSGDSAEKWFQTKSEYSIKEALDLRDSSTVTAAGHPTETVPFLQRLLINRDEWTLNDMNEAKLDGIQILNGRQGIAFEKGMLTWIKLLLRGKKIFIAAGNDAHGNFNRFRQIGIPFFLIAERRDQIFGKMRTAVHCLDISEENILDSLRKGKSQITNGPIMSVLLKNEAGGSASPGNSIPVLRGLLEVSARSSREFGNLSEITIYVGKIGDEQESIVAQKKKLSGFETSFAIPIEFVHHQRPGYIRAECKTEKGIEENSNGFCYTNPIWLVPSGIEYNH
jgi:hypothetical protein